MRWPWRRPRPRKGELICPPGVTFPLRFVPAPDREPGVYVAVHKHGGDPVALHPGDRLLVDRLGPGQSIVIDAPEPVTPRVTAYRKGPK